MEMVALIKDGEVIDVAWSVIERLEALEKFHQNDSK